MNHDRRARHPYLRWSTWLWYGLIAAIGIPWYWSPGQDATLLGMPAWAFTSLLAGCLASSYTAWLLLRHWPGEEEEEDA